MPEIGRFGLSQVYAPTGGGKVDVVFVHGLNGDPQKTWTSEKSKTFWPSQLLPPILEEEKVQMLMERPLADPLLPTIATADSY